MFHEWQHFICNNPDECFSMVWSEDDLLDISALVLNGEASSLDNACHLTTKSGLNKVRPHIPSRGLTFILRKNSCNDPNTHIGGLQNLFTF